MRICGASLLPTVPRAFLSCYRSGIMAAIWTRSSPMAPRILMLPNDSHIGGEPSQPVRCFPAAGERSRNIVPTRAQRIREIESDQRTILDEQTKYRLKHFLHRPSQS
jgi:hypothetical protein